VVYSRRARSMSGSPLLPTWKSRSVVARVVAPFRACMTVLRASWYTSPLADDLAALALNVHDKLTFLHVYEHVTGVIVPVAHPARS
jgi:hypothetical protein